jgi:xylulokinase
LTRDTLLGIDLGTSGLKAALFDLDGHVRGLGRVASRYLPGPAGWAEQDPGAWWTACCEAVHQALAAAGVPASGVAAVGVCGFHHCPVFLGADGQPVRPTIVTHDSRLAASLDDLRASGVLDRVSAISGSRVMTGHFPPIYHLVRTQDPGGLDATRWILLAKDYLRFRLTGEIGTELCDATGTNLVAMPGQDWSDQVCSLLGVPPDRLPPIARSGQVAGAVTEAAARATGLRAGTPVVYGGGDSHCALLGLGIAGSGEAGLLLGTNSTLRASFTGPIRPPEDAVWIQQHVVPGRFTVSASSMAGSSALAWFRRTCLGDTGEGPLPYAEIESWAAVVPAGSDGLLFHPYLFGERSPFYNPQARGAFLGLRHWHGRGHLARSIMEGVAFAVANCLDALRAVARSRNETLHLVRTGQSGGSQLPLWRQIIAAAVDQPIEEVDVDEPGCLGAALLAGAGTGLYDDIPRAISRAVRVAGCCEPDPAAAALYRDRRALFNDVYRALEERLYRQ